MPPRNSRLKQGHVVPLPGRSRKAGWTITEAFFVALIVALVLTVFIRFMFSVRRQHDLQTSGFAGQTSFIHLCDDIHRDLAGSQDHTAARAPNGRYTLIIARKDGEITYDFSPEQRTVTRSRPNGSRTYHFSGDRREAVEMRLATDTLGKTPYLSLSIDIDSKPPLHLERRFDAKKAAQDGKFFPATEIP
ncbi:hypothetical protein KBA41_16605 [Candidatus Ozemobacteraceae bacterium]|nr:hypothetical protein [Candidatus Ozemobacteraceae bacterium]